MRALVLCAGLGTRLGALTRNLPKPLLPIGDRPLLDHTLSHLAGHGFDEIAINVHYCAEAIRSHVGATSPWGQVIRYLDEPVLLGTAGTVYALREFLTRDSECIVWYGDLLCDQDLTAMLAQHRSREATATLLVHKRRGSNSVLDIDPQGRIVAFSERPDPRSWLQPRGAWVNSGIQLLSRELIKRIPPRAPLDLPRDVFAPGVLSERIFGFPQVGCRVAIDSPARYQEAVHAVLDGRFRPRSPASSFGR